jgi:putative spermidine/putrescine transport system permease protein
MSGALTAPRLRGRAWGTVVWVVMGFVLLNIAGLIAEVGVNSLATRWFGTWLPDALTTRWYLGAWEEFALPDVLLTTMEVVFAVVLISAVVGVPAAYALARSSFPGKRLVTLLFLLPLIVPSITYGIPLATVLYRVGLGGTIWGVILANLVPSVPFVILTMTPFIEQLDPRLEAAARVFGARTPSLFRHVLVPMLAPGILAASLLVLVRTIGMFELTFLTAGPDSQTLVVALYYAAFAPGIRAGQSVDAMAVVYMGVTLFWLVVALRFIDPAAIVGRGRPAH